MALLFIDGFDHYDDATLKWDSHGIEVPTYVAGRFGGFAVEFQGLNSDGILKDMTIFNGGSSYPEVYVGFAFYMTDGILKTGNKFYFIDSEGTEVATLNLNGAAKFELKRGGTILATGTTNISTSTWHYVELRYKPLNSGGVFEVRVNEVVDATFTGDTTNGLENVASVKLGDSGANGVGEDLFDDFYFLDTSTAFNNTYLGDVRVVTKAPNADTATKQFSPDTGSTNYTQVDEINTVDLDTSYVENGTLGATDLYTYPALGAVGNVYGVQVCACTRKTDAEVRKFKHVLDPGGGESIGTIEWNLDASYQIETGMYQLNPDTGTLWTVGQVDAVKSGIKVTT